MASLKWEVWSDYGIWTILPFGTDTEGWIPITTIGDARAKYLTPDGKIVDCEVYYQQYCKELRDLEVQTPALAPDIDFHKQRM